MDAAVIFLWFCALDGKLPHYAVSFMTKAKSIDCGDFSTSGGASWVLKTREAAAALSAAFCITLPALLMSKIIRKLHKLFLWEHSISHTERENASCLTRQTIFMP